MWQYRLREAGVLLAVLISVGGCSFIPALPSLSSPSGTAFKRSPPPTAVQAEPAETARWTVLNDPVLDRLQRQLLQDNLTLATASVQVRRAQASLATAQASLWPSVNLNTGVTRSARPWNSRSPTR